LHHFAVLIIIFVFLQSCMYSELFTQNGANLSESNSIRNQVVTYPKIKDLNQELSKINEEKTRFTLNANIEDNFPDEDLEKQILSQNIVDELIGYAYSYLGTPYRYGGATRRGIDCSAFVRSVYREVTDIKLPRTSANQAIEGEKISKSDLKRGDLVFFANSTRGRISHVGIVENVSDSGEVKFIHAARSKGVMVSSLKNSYWGKRFRYAKRIVSLEQFLMSS